MNGRKVRVATMALGSTWRKMMVRSATPRALRGADIVEIARAQELGADDADKARSSRTQQQEQDA